MTTASVVQAQAHADCNGLQGSSVVTNLAFGGSSVVVTGAPNQMTSIPGVATLVINEQIIDPSGTVITVNALPQPWNGRGGDPVERTCGDRMRSAHAAEALACREGSR